MKRGLVLVSLFLILILSVSLVSASWFSDFWGKITGRAVNSSTRSTRICTDSDGGKEIYIKGTVTYEYKNTNKRYVDTCDKKGKKLKEYYCDDKNRERSKVYKCENGCVEGACKVLEEIYQCPGGIIDMVCHVGSNVSTQDINYTEDTKIKIWAYGYPKSVSEGDYFNITLEIKNKENQRKNLSFYIPYEEDKFELISNLPPSLILEPSKTKKLQITFKGINSNVYPPGKNQILFVFNNKEYVISLYVFIGVSNDFIECGGVKFPKSYGNPCSEGSSCDYYDSAKCCNNVFYPSFECCSDSDCDIGKKCVDGRCISKYLNDKMKSDIPKGNIKTLVILSSNEGFSDQNPCSNKKEKYLNLVNGTENYFDEMAKIYLNENSNFINFNWTFIGNFNIQDLGLNKEVDPYELAVKAADYCNLNIQNYQEIIVSNPSQTQWCKGLHQACAGRPIMIIAPILLSSSMVIPHEIAHNFGCKDLYVTSGGLYQWGKSLMSTGGRSELPEGENLLLSILNLGDLVDLQVCRGEMGWVDLDNNNILEIYELPEKLEVDNIESYFKEDKNGERLYFNLSFVLITNNNLRKQIPDDVISSLNIMSSCYLEKEGRDLNCGSYNGGIYITDIWKEELINFDNDYINLSFTYEPYLNKILQASVQVSVNQILQS